jgi:hypothetical protein
MMMLVTMLRFVAYYAVPVWLLEMQEKLNGKKSVDIKHVKELNIQNDNHHIIVVFIEAKHINN